jgi:hypothetical protein
MSSPALRVVGFGLDWCCSILFSLVVFLFEMAAIAPTMTHVDVEIVDLTDSFPPWAVDDAPMAEVREAKLPSKSHAVSVQHHYHLCLNQSLIAPTSSRTIETASGIIIKSTCIRADISPLTGSRSRKAMSVGGKNYARTWRRFRLRYDEEQDDYDDDREIGGTDNQKDSDDNQERIATVKDFYSIVKPLLSEWASLAPQNCIHTIKQRDEISAFFKKQILERKKAKHQEDQSIKKPSRSSDPATRRKLIFSNPQLGKSTKYYGNRRPFLLWRF